MSDLTEFLMARVAEDEADAARAANYYPDDGPFVRWDSDRVLAECAAKRRVVDALDALIGHDKTYVERLRHTDAEDAAYILATDALRALALPYADHPDYRQEWKP